MKRNLNLRSRHVPTHWKGTKLVYLSQDLYMLPLYAVIYAKRNHVNHEEINSSHCWPLVAYSRLVWKLRKNDLRSYRNDYRNYGMLIERFHNMSNRTSYNSNFVKKSHKR